MDNLFNAQVCFNGGNPNMFKVRNDVTLKELKDQLMKSTNRSTTETQGGWNTFGISVHCWTQRGD